MANEPKEPHFVDELFGGRREDTISILVIAVTVGALAWITIENVDNHLLQVLIVIAGLAVGATAHVWLGRRRRNTRPGGPPNIETIP